MLYARSREYAERLMEQHETVAEEAPNIQVIGIQTKAELDEYIKELRDTAGAPPSFLEGGSWFCFL
jgi:hypothetical protein